MNELIFFCYCILLATASLIALRFGKEALVSIICLQTILSNILVTKTITLFGVTATASDALAVGGILSLNLLQEYYGKTSAEKAIWISFSAGILYVFITQLHLNYEPSLSDICHTHFVALMQHTPRLVAASYVTYLISQKLEVMLYGFIREKLHHRFFLVRNIISLSITQWFDTVLFTLLGLYGILDNLGHIMIISYTIKLITLLSMAPFIAGIKKIITV
jgi:queuosine precursor transporter